jgi:hypothetical protein
MRIIIPMFMFVTSCSPPPSARNDEGTVIADPDVTHEYYMGLERWVDSRYNVVCYAYFSDTLECFPISEEGHVQYSLDFQNQAN